MRLLLSLPIAVGLLAPTLAAAETTGPTGPTIYIMSPADLTEYESAPTTIEVVSVSGSDTEEQIIEMGLRVDGVEHPFTCNVPGSCTFTDVTLEMGEHTLEAWAMADGEISDSHTVYVGVPAPQTTDTDTDTDATGGDTTGSDTTGSDTSGDTAGDTTGDTTGDDSSGATTSDGAGDTSSEPEGEGCACATTEGGFGLSALFLGLLGFKRRRR